VGKGWRSLARCALLSFALAVATRATAAEAISVPIALQIELLNRLLHYERGLQRGSDEVLSVLVLVRARNNESVRAAGQIEAQLAREKSLGGKKLAYDRLLYETPEQLKRALVQRKVYLLYLAPGFEDVLPAIATTLRGVRVLTVSTSGADVARGAVLGFELVSSKPRIALNLPRARDQHMDFSAQLLRIARVIK
jgi:hypothetical protein